MTSLRRGTDRPFTVVVCGACAADPTLSVLDEMRPVIQCCPNSMLVAAACVFGPLICASRPEGGAIVMLQPCALDRTPCGQPYWLGPVADANDAAALREWLLLGQREDSPPPWQLGKHQRWLHYARQSN